MSQDEFYNRLSHPGDAEMLVIAADLPGNAITLNESQRFVNVDMGNANITADQTITLPSATRMRGQIVSVMVTSADGTYDCVVVGPGVGTDYNSGDMDGALDVVVLMSDGWRWIAIHEDKAH